MNPSIADIRKDYQLQSLHEAEVFANPFDQFGKWWQQAIDSQAEEVNAMTLATATPDGKPSARIVLLKDYSEAGFVFFTNYNSDKGREMAANPHVALVFFWKELERQVRIEGIAAKVPEADSDAYFASRPQGSRLGAWASPQSSVISGREVLEQNIATLSATYADGFIPRPPHWGGYIVKPELIEFWQGRSSRLHDRLEYRLHNNIWTMVRLAP